VVGEIVNAMPTPSHPPADRPHRLEPETLGRHLDRLMRAALAMCGSRADAEDLVQEACLRVLAKPRVVRGSELAYLHGVLRNTFISEYQKRARRRTTPVEPETLHQVPDGRRFDPELGTLAREVHRAIADLPAHYRDAVVAVDILGLQYAEAAAALDVPVGTIMSRLYRGREAVAAQVGAPELVAA
jgi:RNA polymerase sigma-70 factor (ECF subfamily)